MATLRGFLQREACVDAAPQDSLLTRLFNIRPLEQPRVLLLFTYLLCAVGAFIIGRNVRDTLFLSHFDRDVLVYMYISQAVVVALPAWLYARYTNQFRRDRLLGASLMAMMVISLTLYGLIHLEQSWVFIVLYNWICLLYTSDAADE